MTSSDARLRLSLREGVSPPWLARAKGQWLYCQSCSKHRVGKDSPSKGFVPFRDRSSQALLKPPSAKRPKQLEPDLRRDEEVEGPACDDAQFDTEKNIEDGNLSEVSDAADGDFLDIAPQVGHLRLPSLDEYRRKWKREEAKHTKGNDQPFGHINLVPKPNRVLMQDVPWVPFDSLVCPEAQTRLSVVKPHRHPVRESEYPAIIISSANK